MTVISGAPIVSTQEKHPTRDDSVALDPQIAATILREAQSGQRHHEGGLVLAAKEK